MAEAKGGLDGVVVADTSLSLVDGEAGRLIVAGHEIESLAGRVPFEDVCHLLWEGRLPSAAERRAQQRALGRLIRPTARYVGPRPEPMSA